MAPWRSGYGYDADSRLTALSYTTQPGNNLLGQINYSYDNDGRVTGESGSLVGINLPQSEGPNTYSQTNQILTWNNQPATTDSASNLTSDPVTNATYTWDSRNQLSGISGGPAISFTGTYDAVMRRYSQRTAYGGTTTYLHDQKNVAQSNNSTGGSTGGTNAINNYLTIPGTGEVLAFTTTNGGTYVPLQDGRGSALGLVNSSNALQTQYTYDPFGNVSTSGTASAYPYLYGGMEYDTTGLYYNGGAYYSPQLGRPLQQVTPGGQGGGGGMGAAGLPGSSGGGGLSSEGQDGVAVGAGITAGFAGISAVGATAAATAGADVAAGVIVVTAGAIACAVVAVAALVLGILDLFGLFGGGGSAPVISNGFYRMVHHLYEFITGAPYALTPDQKNSIPYEAPFHGRVIWVSGPAILPGVTDFPHRLLGVAFPFDGALRWYVGPPLSEIFGRVLPPDSGSELIERAVSLYLERFATHGAQKNTVYPGIADVLGKLRINRRLFLVTSKNTAVAEQILTAHFLRRHFEGVIGTERDDRFANKTDAVRFILEGAKLDLAATAIVGDREHDVIAGNRNGIFTIGVTYGYGTMSELFRAGADYICDNPGCRCQILERGINVSGFGLGLL